MTRRCANCKSAPTDTRRGKYCEVCRKQILAANNQKFVAAIWPTAQRSFEKETR